MAYEPDPLGCRFYSWHRSVGQGSGITSSCRLSCKCSSDLALLWLWHRLAAAALIWPQTWELPYVMGAAIKNKNKKFKKRKYISQVFIICKSLRKKSWGYKDEWDITSTRYKFSFESIHPIPCLSCSQLSWASHQGKNISTSHRQMGSPSETSPEFHKSLLCASCSCASSLAYSLDTVSFCPVYMPLSTHLSRWLNYSLNQQSYLPTHLPAR